MKFLRKNLHLKLIALILSIFLWAYVRYAETGSITGKAQAYYKIPLKIVNLDKNLVALEVPDYITITVEGTEDFLKTIRPDSFEATIDIDGKTQGQWSVPIQLQKPPGIKVLEKNPPRALINITKKDEKNFDITFFSEGIPQKGFLVGEIKFIPTTVKIIAPKSYLDLVDKVIVKVNVEKLNESIIAKVFPIAIDNNGDFIKEVTIIPEEVTMNLILESSYKSSFIPVRPNLSGNLPEGFAITFYQVIPTCLKLRHKKNIKPPMELLTEPIELSSLNKTIIINKKVIIPEGLELKDENEVQIKFNINKI